MLAFIGLALISFSPYSLIRPKLPTVNGGRYVLLQDALHRSFSLLDQLRSLRNEVSQL